jgi:hypothetical protein
LSEEVLEGVVVVGEEVVAMAAVVVAVVVVVMEVFEIFALVQAALL